jgi:hypothetical protein
MDEGAFNDQFRDAFEMCPESLGGGNIKKETKTPRSRWNFGSENYKTSSLPKPFENYKIPDRREVIEEPT